MPFSPDTNPNERDYFTLYLSDAGPISRARLQDYARKCERSVDDWLVDAIEWFMHECDRQFDAVAQADIPRTDTEIERPPEWRLRLADSLHTMAERVAGDEE